MKKFFNVLIYGLLMIIGTSCNSNDANNPSSSAKRNGALNGAFSISNTKQVHFSMGNLQYQPSSKKWRFAENQYDTIGKTNINISASCKDWIDLFGWGTGNNPTNTSSDHRKAYPTFTDWGINPISNGGKNANAWRTLSYEEWYYIFYERTNANKLLGPASVNGIHGLVLLPDNWSTPVDLNFIADIDNWTINEYTVSQWSQMESAGAVFLPAAGYRDFTPDMKVYSIGVVGEYWSSTPDGSGGYAGGFSFSYDKNRVLFGDYYRRAGQSVRLVQDL